MKRWQRMVLLAFAVLGLMGWVGNLVRMNRARALNETSRGMPSR